MVNFHFTPILLFLVALCSLWSVGFLQPARFPRFLTFYVHVIRAPLQGQVQTSFPFVGVTNTTFTIGYPSAFDNKVTVAPDYNSPEISRSQGFFVITSLSGRNATISINLNFLGFLGYVLTGGKFDFSTNLNDLTIIQGTGDFTGARGIYRVVTLRRYGPNQTNSLLYGQLRFSY